MDITDALINYRKATTFIWNEYFRQRVGSLRECGPLDDYEEIDRRLFSGLVVRVIEDALTSNGADSGYQIEAIPPTEIVEVMFGDDHDGYWKWHLPVSIDMKEFRPRFFLVELFDFDRYGSTVLPLVKCRYCSDDVDDGSKEYALLNFDDCRYVVFDRN